MKKIKNNKNWNYQPKHTVGECVISVGKCSVKWGTIKQVDNECNWRHYRNPMPEYYIKWRSGNWSRYNCNELDDPEYVDEVNDKIIIGSYNNLRLIYGK